MKSGGERRVRVARDGRQPSTRMQARLRAQHGTRPEARRATARGRGRKGCEYATHGAAIHVSTPRARSMSASASAAHGAAPRASSSHAGGSLQPSAAARKQAGACSPDKARTVHAAKAGLRAVRTGSASAQAAQKPQGQCEPLGRGPTRPSMQGGGRCLAQGRLVHSASLPWGACRGRCLPFARHRPPPFSPNEFGSDHEYVLHPFVALVSLCRGS